MEIERRGTRRQAPREALSALSNPFDGWIVQHRHSPNRGHAMDTVLFDLRFALRSLRRRRTFAAVAITTIALSIGAATSIYSVVDGVLFRSLPYRDAGRLVAIWQTDSIRKAQPL